jgi:hypothetical protein
VKELEEQLSFQVLKAKEEQEDQENLRPLDVKLTVSLPTNLDPLGEHGGNKKYYNWDFISASTAKFNQQCYGPSSSFYFIGQMSKYLDMALQQHHRSDIQLTSPSRCFSSPTTAGRNEYVQSVFQSSRTELEQHLSRSHEEYFLEMFWGSHHWFYPMIDEAEFRAHYNSLWETSGLCRKPSALVDIVLALCLQYGAARTPPCRITSDDSDEHGDATIAGRHYYRMCQSQLTDELEGPSITTFQCYLLSIIWLMNASFQNMAHSVLATGIRTGVILGLHLEPSLDLPENHRNFRKRLWWTMYGLEMKMAMDLGRPLGVSISQVTCSIPEDKFVRSDSPNEHEIVPKTIFNTQGIKLILATRAIYITFYHACADVLGTSGHKSLYSDPEGLEACAKSLFARIGYLHTWLQQVPEVLRIERRNSGEPYSTDRSALELPSHPGSSFELTQQAVVLEIMYHDFSMSLYRPFISFSRVSSASTPLTEGHAISCVNHGITITNIIHQMLTETDLLNGWHQIFQWQWNSTLSLIGYILAYPAGPSTPAARKALSTAITIFEHLSPSFASAVSAANVARDLSAKADLLMERYRTSMALGGSPGSPLLPLKGSPIDSYFPYEFEPSDFDPIFQNTLTSSTGFTFSFDSIGGCTDLGSDGSTFYDLLDFGDAREF